MRTAPVDQRDGPDIAVTPAGRELRREFEPGGTTANDHYAVPRRDRGTRNVHRVRRHGFAEIDARGVFHVGRSKQAVANYTEYSGGGIGYL